jgi:hypothetical protein
MKTLISFILTSSIALAIDPLSFNFDYNEEANYASMIQTAFTKQLTSDASLSKEFSKFESPPPKEARGRYYEDPTISSIVVSEEEHVDIKDISGMREFKKTIALYYRFDNGMHRGKVTNSGFFALFVVTGKYSYSNLANNDIKILKSSAVAEFKGFSRTLVAPEPDE